MKALAEIAHRAGMWCFIMMVAFLCGCSTVGGPRGNEAVAIQRNRQAIVLARLICVDEVQGQKRPTCDFTLDSWRLDKADGQMEFSPHEERVPRRSLSKSLRDQGWFYAVIEPGSYCLRVIPTGDHLTQPAFYLTIQTNKQLVYAGTIVFDRRTEKPGKKEVTTITLSGISDESQLAKAVIAGELDKFGEMTRSLLVSYDSPVINSDQPVKVEGTQATLASATPVVRGDNWQPAGYAAAPLVYLGTGLLQASANGNGNGAGYVAAIGGGLLLISAPVVFTTEGITAEVHRKRWAPYEVALRKQVATFDLKEKLQRAIANRLAANGTNSAATPALRLEAQPYRVVLRGDEHQRFGLEVAARVRLWSPTGGSVIWEHNYACAHYAPNRVVDNASETMIPSECGQYRLEDYRGDSGAGILLKELNSAVGQISDACAAAIRFATTSNAGTSAGAVAF